MRGRHALKNIERILLRSGTLEQVAARGAAELDPMWERVFEVFGAGQR